MTPLKKSTESWPLRKGLCLSVHLDVRRPVCPGQKRSLSWFSHPSPTLGFFCFSSYPFGPSRLFKGPQGRVLWRDRTNGGTTCT